MFTSSHNGTLALHFTKIRLDGTVNRPGVRVGGHFRSGSVRSKATILERRDSGIYMIAPAQDTSAVGLAYALREKKRG